MFWGAQLMIKGSAVLGLGQKNNNTKVLTVPTEVLK